MDKNAIAIAEQIGQFYLQKNNGDYEKAADEIYRLQVTEILPIGTMVVIKLSRVGLLIGRRGENVTQLEKFINRKIHMVENTQSIQDYIIPRPQPDVEYEYEYEYDYPPDPLPE